MTNRRKFLNQASAGAAAVSLPLLWPASAQAQWTNQPEKGAKNFCSWMSWRRTTV